VLDDPVACAPLSSRTRGTLGSLVVLEPCDCDGLLSVPSMSPFRVLGHPTAGATGEDSTGDANGLCRWSTDSPTRSPKTGTVLKMNVS
jgi:hypothetical protein